MSGVCNFVVMEMGGGGGGGRGGGFIRPWLLFVFLYDHLQQWEIAVLGTLRCSGRGSCIVLVTLLCALWQFLNKDTN